MKLRTIFFGGCACIVIFYIAYQAGTSINETTSGPSPTQIADHTAKAKAAIKENKVFVGMTTAEAESSWGKPEHINRTTTAHTQREQWVYKNNSFLYFENGVLTTIQN
jgi:hypothetical protein